MKYYVLNYRYKRHRGVINYGDNLQSIAVQHLLGKFGITEEQIGHIVRDDMGRKVADREPGIFIPATGGMAWNAYPAPSDFPIDEHNLVILYFGIRIPEGSFDVIRNHQPFIASLKRHEPIGCRDVATRDFVRSLGARAFFSKCVTLSFDTRPDSMKGAHFYIFKETKEEVIEAFRESVPAHIWDVHKELPITLNAPRTGPMTDADCFVVNKQAIERLNILREDAKLVISRRIHVVIPCAALGIPVIFIDAQPNESRTQVARYLLPTTSIQGLSDLELDDFPATDLSAHKDEMRLLFGYSLELAEKRFGSGKTYLDDHERLQAKILLDRRCDEDEPINTYIPQSFTTERLLDVMFESRKSDVLAKRKPIVIFGAGEFGGRIKTILERANLTPACYVDNAVSSDGVLQRHALHVISFETLCRDHKDSYIILAAPGYQEEMLSQLKESGFNESVIIDTTDFCREYIEYIPPLDGIVA